MWVVREVNKTLTIKSTENEIGGGGGRCIVGAGDVGAYRKREIDREGGREKESGDEME